MATYEFSIILFGEGHEEKEAWLDAVEKFTASPGQPESNFGVTPDDDDDDDEQLDWEEELELGDSINGVLDDDYFYQEY